MKKNLGVLLILLLTVLSLCMPAFTVHVHNTVEPEIAAAFPASISAGSILLQGNAVLPTSVVPQLAMVPFPRTILLIGLVLLAASAGIALLKKRGTQQLAIAGSAAACGLLAVSAFRMNDITASLLFGYMLESQFWIYAPAVLAALLGGWLWLQQHAALKAAPDQAESICLPIGENTWRRMGAVLAILAALSIFLPYAITSVPATITESVSANTINRSISLFDYALDGEGTLNAAVVAAGEGTDVLTGDIGALNTYSNQSASNNNIKYIFQNPSANTAPNVYVLLAAGLLLLAALLALHTKFDRWFSLCLEALGMLAAAAALIPLLSIDAGDFYSKASRQLVYLGVGYITPVPAIMALLAAGSFVCGAMCVRRANVPYFINPLPQKIRIRVVAVTLAVLSVVTFFLPSASFTFYKAGATSTASVAEISGIDALTFSMPDDVAHPKDKKGKIMYEAEPKKEGILPAASVEASMNAIATANSVTSWVALVLTVAGLALLLLNRPQKISIILFCSAFAVRVLQWALITFQMPSVIGEAAGAVWLYVSMPLLLFAAFFTAFAHLNEIPKKYRLFLMMLPFLVSVFLFSYLPLAGWRYAFYNYKFGQPWSTQEFVGFQWFREMFTNLGHFTNIVRVMQNTLGMSLLGLAFSWLPMMFAIFLNEINSPRFKKFVQIFTTLPNFISWALVFSFAMAMFSMETGIFSKFMLAIGAIDQPVAWLNSSEHIWLKMWTWSLWKGLGWNSIMYLAAIAGIDQEMYEAARVDGANRWNVIRHITIPSLLPTFFVLLLLSISNIINSGMEQYLVFQNAMNKATIEVLDLYVYNITIASKGTTMYSFGTAIGILKTIVSVTLLFSANFASKKLRGESIV